jgi:hypothetical protein
LGVGGGGGVGGVQAISTANKLTARIRIRRRLGVIITASLTQPGKSVKMETKPWAFAVIGVNRYVMRFTCRRDLFFAQYKLVRPGKKLTIGEESGS